MGIKGNDNAAVDPVTNKLRGVQSWNNVFPTKIKMCKETKEVVLNDFGPLFKEFDTLCSSTFVEEQGYHPIRLAANMDMSAKWKCIGRGGAAKQVTHPCESCAITSADLAEPNTGPCRWCRVLRHDNRPHIKCFHKEMLTKERVEAIQLELPLLKEKLETALSDLSKARER